MKINNLDKLNVFYFIPILSLGVIFFLDIPDLDQSIPFLDHRSIFTHSILFPYLLYYYLIRKIDKPNIYLNVIVISFFLAVGIHLSADLHPKSWRGFANIKLLGKDLGGFSFFWILINSSLSFILGAYILKQLSNKRAYLVIFLVVTIIIGIFYSFNEAVNNSKILFTIILLSLASTYHVFRSDTKYLLRYTKKLEPEKNPFFTLSIKKKLFKILKIIVILYVLWMVFYLSACFLFSWCG